MSVLHLLSRLCEGERRAKHFIFNLASLYPTFREAKGSRVIAHSKKNHTTNSRSMAREAVVRRHSFAQQVIRFYYHRFVCVSSSFGFKARRMCERDKVGSRQPMCQSKCPFKNLRSRKKEERILSADDDIFYALLNSLFR